MAPISTPEVSTACGHRPEPQRSLPALAAGGSAAYHAPLPMARDFLTGEELTPDELSALLDRALELKAGRSSGEGADALAGKSIALVFEKPSTRTRVSFEVGIHELGGTGLYLSAGDLQLGRGETIKDTANVLDRYLDAIMIRTFAQEDVEELAEHAEIPVINGLTDYAHPCQALADLMTIRERLERLSGVRLAYLGDGNNVCISLMLGAARFGMRFVAAVPEGYNPDENAVTAAKRAAVQMGGTVELVRDPKEAAQDADVLYTDVWTSMGKEEEAERRRSDLADYRIDEALLSLASPDAIVLHCLPAHYGEEITEDVLYGPQSAVWDQAENRLHSQKALMALIVD
jgi:ornithine carbamoyltransferase